MSSDWKLSKEARSPAKSWVSGNNKAKLKENVKDIKGLLATDREFRGHMGGFLELAMGSEKRTCRAILEVQAQGGKGVWEAGLL